MARMKQIVEAAKKRRAALLKKFCALDITIAEFAERNNMTSVRMGQLLKKARKEHELAHW